MILHFVIVAFSCIPFSLIAAMSSLPPKGLTASEMQAIPPPPLMKVSPTPSYVSIPLKDRAMDFLEAFNTLKREKVADRVFFQLSDNSSISSIIDLTLLPSGSLFLFRYNTNNQGIRLQVVKVEDIEGVGYY